MTAKSARLKSPAGRERRQPASARRARAAVRAAVDGVAPITIRAVRRPDLEPIIALDARVTGLEKRDYWRSVYRRYGEGALERQFLVAESGGEVVGFVIGEVRDWEFGSARCGWVFAIDVSPEARLRSTGARLLAAVCAG